jgi:hypothetical protein
MRDWQAGDAAPGERVEAVDCSLSGVIVAVDREAETVSVRVDDPRFTGVRPGTEMEFPYRDVELVAPEDE